MKPTSLAYLICDLSMSELVIAISFRLYFIQDTKCAQPKAASHSVLQFPPEIRKITYTINAIESMNMTMRKYTRNRRVFPNDESRLLLSGAVSAKFGSELFCNCGR